VYRYTMSTQSDVTGPYLDEPRGEGQVSECHGLRGVSVTLQAPPHQLAPSHQQGLTLVHIFAQPEPFWSLKPAKHPTTWDRNCSR